jgi:hypothetical protein
VTPRAWIAALAIGLAAAVAGGGNAAPAGDGVAGERTTAPAGDGIAALADSFPAAAADSARATAADSTAAAVPDTTRDRLAPPAARDTSRAPAGPPRMVLEPPAAPRDTVEKARRPSRWAKWERGLSLGIGVTDFTGQLGKASDIAQIGYELGGYAGRRVGPARLEPRAQIAYRGARFRSPKYVLIDNGSGDIDTVRIGDVEYTLSLVYLEIPVLARLPLGGASFEPHLVAGAMPTLFLFGNAQTDFGFNNLDTGDLRRLGWSWMAGLGTRWPTGWGALGVDLRYVRGADDAYKTGLGLPGENEAWTLGLTFEQGASPTPRPAGGPRRW